MTNQCIDHEVGSVGVDQLVSKHVQLDEYSGLGVVHVVFLFAIVSAVVDHGDLILDGLADVHVVGVTVNRADRDMTFNFWPFLSLLSLLIMIENVCSARAGRGEVKTEATTIELKGRAGLESLGSTLGAVEFDIAKPTAAAFGVVHDAYASKPTKLNKRLFERLLLGGPAQIAHPLLPSPRH